MIPLNHSWARGWQYFNYWLDALDAHSLHAPFVYQLFTEVINDQGKNRFAPIDQFRGKVYRDRHKILVNDLGAGGTSKAQKRIVGNIARSSHSPKVGRLLANLVTYCGASNILELGTGLGLTTLYLAQSAPRGNIVTIEGCPNLGRQAAVYFKEWGFNDIIQHIGDIAEQLPSAIRDLGAPDLVFIDANHRYTPTINYFETCVKEIHEKSVMVLDDIHWSWEMNKAWNEIRKHPRVHISIDLYRVGLLFFDPITSKEHFVLKF